MLSVEESLALLVRQQVHQIQHQEKTRGRRGYENKDFIERMKAIGLIVHKGAEGNGKGAYREKHHEVFIAPEGPFARAARRLIDEGFRARWADRFLAHVQVTPEELVQAGLRQAEAAAASAGQVGGGTQDEEGPVKVKLKVEPAAGYVAPAQLLMAPALEEVAANDGAGTSVPPIVASVEGFVIPPPRESKFKFQCPRCRCSA